MMQFIEFLVSTVASWGYGGIFILMAIESSVIPLPSELVMIPAGYLVYKGEMNCLWVIASGTLGSIVGALANYYLAKFVGRKFVQTYGRYFFVSPEKFSQVEQFFHRHGSFSTFSGRLIPVVRHLISLVAGLALVRMRPFILYTGVGAGIWVSILTALGYFLGQNELLIKEYLKWITGAILVSLVLGSYVYMKIRSKRKYVKI